MPNAVIDSIQRAIRAHPDDVVAYDDLVSAYENQIRDGFLQYHAENKILRAEISRVQRRIAETGRMADIRRMNDAYWHSALVDAPVDFDAFMLYVEKEREIKKRFYLPRRRQLLKVASAIQELIDNDKLDILGISMPPGT